MALSDPEINLLRLKSRDPFDFARAIEAEVRKQLERPAPCQHFCEAQAFRIERRSDAALIRQLLESMCWAARVMAISEDEAPGYFASIAAARARLVEGGQ